MQKKDLYIALAVACFTAMLSFFVSGAIFNSPKARQTQVPVVEKISPDFADTYRDPAYTMFYNPTAINPTELVRVGEESNPQPFPANQPTNQ